MMAARQHSIARWISAFWCAGKYQVELIGAKLKRLTRPKTV
jgi:hypothetical protein